MSVNPEQDYNTLLHYLQAEYEHPFSGWDFSYLDGRRIEDWSTLTWDYRAAIEARLPQTRSLLDLGTGGGEYLASLKPLPADTRATEGYAPNIPIARQRLEPLGVHVYEIKENLLLPLENECFELVIDRHEAYLPREVLRVLQPGGLFITQQVDGGDFYEDLDHLLGASTSHIRPEWHLSYAVSELEGAGFEILEQAEAWPVTRFYDAGAIVYYLKAIPWQISDFSVEKYLPALEKVHQQIQRDHFVEVHGHYFFIVARKP
jgi:SAM-dependent methyltransferase